MPAAPPEPAPAEAALLTALRAGEAWAFEHLVARYGPAVLNTCMGLVRDVAEAEDLTQEVFVEVFESVATFRGEARLSTWLYRVAVNKALEWRRRQRRRKRFAFLTSLFGDGAALRHDAPDFVHPGIVAERQEQATLLFRAIDRLPARQQAAFTLFHLEHLPQPEIAAVLNVSIGAVESLLHRAKATLRHELRSLR